MTDIARDLCQALLDHHQWIRDTRPPEHRHVPQCVITYGALCDVAGHPEVVRSVGRYLQEVAEWCIGRFPPLNSLAVNGETRLPGDKYDVAPGCSLLNWPAEAEACLRCESYPEEVD